MFQRSRQWFTEVLWRPKNPLSLDHLKYLHMVLGRNGVVTERNRNLLVESIRSIAEILIWGDQNDARVFDFFLEKNMFRAFLKILQQRTSPYVPVQMLQTLNILFENIQNETAIYYLLSNNHVNAFIVHRYDFSDEEILAYYVSFLKTLSLKLNQHTIHFFFNEHLRDFPLYTEAIKFFNHSESMVRIAVRTITLNVYKVGDEATLNFICNRTAAPYFSNLVWFIGKHVLELDDCVRTDAHHLRCHRLTELVAEHLDQLHYLNDILCLGIQSLNRVLTTHLLDRLLIPLYIYSLTDDHSEDGTQGDRPNLCRMVALFLLSQVFLILSHPPLVSSVVQVVLHGDSALPELLDAEPTLENDKQLHGSMGSIRAFVPPPEPLADTLMASSFGYVPAVLPEKGLDQTPSIVKRRVGNLPRQSSHSPEYLVIHSETECEVVPDSESGRPPEPRREANSTFFVGGLNEMEREAEKVQSGQSGTTMDPLGAISCQEMGEVATAETQPRTDETTSISSLPVMEVVKSELASSPPPPDLVASTLPSQSSSTKDKSVSSPCDPMSSLDQPFDHRVYLAAILNALSFKQTDLEPLFALCLVYGIVTNNGVEKKILEDTNLISSVVDANPYYHAELVAAVIQLIEKICNNGSHVRLVTLSMCIKLLHELLPHALEDQQRLADDMLALLQGASEASTLQLRLFYKGAQDDIFLDMFEDEFYNVIVDTKPLNVEYLMMDASMLLPPTGTPMTGIEFNRRLPCGEVERSRRAMQIFFSVRQLWQTLTNEVETELPLTNIDEAVNPTNTLDLNNSDLIACTVVMGERSNKRFLVVSPLQLILVEPDTSHLGWGIVQFVAFLQDVEITTDPASSDCLHVVAHHPTAHNSRSTTRHKPMLTGKLKFDDHIRCSAARQRIQHGCSHVKFSKMVKIARILQLPSPMPPSSLGVGYLAPVTVVQPTGTHFLMPGTKSSSFSNVASWDGDSSYNRRRSVTMPAVTGDVIEHGVVMPQKDDIGGPSSLPSRLQPVRSEEVTDMGSSEDYGCEQMSQHEVAKETKEEVAAGTPSNIQYLHNNVHDV